MSEKRHRLLPIIALCIFCVLSIGGFTSAAILKYVYADVFDAIEAQTAVVATVNGNADSNNSAAFLTDSSSTQASSSPVVRVAKEVGPAVVGITNYQTVYRYRYGSGYTPQLVEAGTGSGFIVMRKTVTL